MPSPEVSSTTFRDDRRQDPRTPVLMLGRFMRVSKHEFPCKMIDISLSGAALMAPVEPDMGEKIIAYFDQFGGLEGNVARNFTGGFAIRFSITEHKRQKLAGTLAAMLDKTRTSGGIERRHYERVVARSKTQTLALGEKFSIDCEILDLSISGASVMTAARPGLGTLLKLGTTNARVVRHHDRGIALEFVDVQKPNALRRYFG